MPYIFYKCTYFNLKSMAFRQAVVAALYQIGNPDWSGKDYARRLVCVRINRIFVESL